MRTIFHPNRKSLRLKVYYVRVCRRKDGYYRYITHGSRTERAAYEEYHSDNYEPLYRINVKPKGDFHALRPRDQAD